MRKDNRKRKKIAQCVCALRRGFREEGWEAGTRVAEPHGQVACGATDIITSRRAHWPPLELGMAHQTRALAAAHGPLLEDFVAALS